MARLDKFPGIFDVSEGAVEATCVACDNPMKRHQHTLDRMKAIDGFYTCSTSCRNAQKLKTPPPPPCS